MIKTNQVKSKETELGLIPEDWEFMNLGKIADFKNGKASPPRNETFKYPTYGANGIIGHTETANSNEDTIIIGRVGAYCGSLHFSESKCWVTDNAIIGKAKNNSDDLYLYYLLQTLGLNNRQGGSGQPLLNQQLLNSIDVLVPKNQLEQKKIAGVLGALDEKIELNRKMNKTLESLAQAIFKKWFIDNANPNWKTKKLKDICEIKNGFAFKSGDYSAEGIFLLRTSNFNSEGYAVKNDPMFLPNNFYQTFSNYRLEKFDVLLVMVGASVGKRSFVFSNILPALQNQNMWNFRAYNPSNQFFLKFLVDQIVESNIGSASGSARDFFRKDFFREIEFSLPDQNPLDKFYKIILPQFEMIDKNIKEIETLSQIRDSLLPRLMNGKLRVK